MTKLKLFQTKDSVFYAALCFSLEIKWSEDIPTACVDGKTMLLNPTFFVGLSVDERLFLLLHETLHCAYLHMLRRMTRDHARWNAACDYVINAHLIERKFKMPASGLYDPQYAGLSAEQVYGVLPEDTECPEPDLGEPKDGDESKEIQARLEDALVRAYVQAKQAGDKSFSNIPGDIQIFIDQLLHPKLPWNRIFMRYLMEYSRDDYSYTRPNRRFEPEYLPRLYSRNLRSLAIAIDTSGSVTDEMFLQMLTEVYALMRMMRPPHIDLIQFDTVIQARDRVRNANDLRRVEFTGRGGTDVVPVLEWADTNKPGLLVFITDGYFEDHELVKPSSDVIWLIYDNPNFQVDFGTVIHVNLTQ